VEVIGDQRPKGYIWILEKIHWELDCVVSHTPEEIWLLIFEFLIVFSCFVENPETPKGEYEMTGKRRARIPMRLMTVLRSFEKFFITTLFKNSFLFKNEAAFGAFYGWMMSIQSIDPFGYALWLRGNGASRCQVFLIVKFPEDHLLCRITFCRVEEIRFSRQTGEDSARSSRTPISVARSKVS